MDHYIKINNYNDVTRRTNQVLKCKYCEHQFTKMCSLKDHLRIHLDQKPFDCSNCGKTFRQKGNRDRHEASKVCYKKWNEKIIIISNKSMNRLLKHRKNYLTSITTSLYKLLFFISFHFSISRYQSNALNLIKILFITLFSN